MNSNYDLFSQTNGLSTNTSISDSASMLDPNQGIYGCGIAPLLPQASQNLSYHQPPQYPPTQELFFLRECCKALEQQLFKTTTERDTMKTLLDQLTTALPNLPAPGLATAIPTPALAEASAEKYPNIRFWTQVIYNTWTNSPEGHADPRWRVAYLEDEDGQTVSEETIKALRKKTRECWTELVEKNMAPKSWGKIRATAKDFAYSVIYKSFPFLQLCQNNWKLDLLCGTDYPGWVRNNLGADGKWAIKQEDNEPLSQPMPGKKRRAGVSVKASQPSGKRIKNDVQEPGPLKAAWRFDDTNLNASFDAIPMEADIRSPFPELAAAVNRPHSPSLDSMYIDTISDVHSSPDPPQSASGGSATYNTTIPATADMHSSPDPPRLTSGDGVASNTTTLTTTDMRSSPNPPQSASGGGAASNTTIPTTADVRSSPDPPQSASGGSAMSNTTTPTTADVHSSPDPPQSASGGSAMSNTTTPTTADVRSSPNLPQSASGDSVTSVNTISTTISTCSSPNLPQLSSMQNALSLATSSSSPSITTTNYSSENPNNILNAVARTPSPPPPNGDSNGSVDQAHNPVVINPIASLNKKSLKIKLPALPALPANVAEKKNNQMNEMEESMKAASGKRKATSRKMRPTKNKTAYNLCAHRWQAQVNENGTSDEFKVYWNKELDEDQREAYKKEVKELVDAGTTWDDNLFSGTLY